MKKDIPSLVYKGLICLALFLFLGSFFIQVSDNSMTIIKLLFSPETFVATTAGVAAIYSWNYQKNISEDEKTNVEYDNNLKMLKDIDDVLEYYKNKPDERNVSVIFQEYVENLSQKFSTNKTERDEFLNIYYKYVKSKTNSSEESLDQDESTSEYDLVKENINDSKAINGNLLDIAESPIQRVKVEIAKSLNISLSNIRYSKNYEEDAHRASLEWTTWFNLRASFIDNLSDNEDIIFFTKVNDKFEGAKISGKSIKSYVKDITARNSKNKDPQYDFYISKKIDDDTYFDQRNDKPIGGLSKFDLDFLMTNKKVKNNE